MKFFEVSSKTGQNVEEAFGSMAESVWGLIASKELEEKTNTRSPTPYGVPAEPGKGSCCRS